MKWQSGMLLAVSGLSATSAFAANDQTLQSSATVVQMTVVNGCILNNTSSGTATLGTLNFGDIYKLNSIRDAVTTTGNGSLELRCTPGTSVKITMNAGLHGSDVNNRKMRLNSGTDTMFISYIQLRAGKLFGTIRLVFQSLLRMILCNRFLSMGESQFKQLL